MRSVAECAVGYFLTIGVTANTQSVVSEHAGVLPYPVESSRSPLWALDAVREEDNQPSPTAPPDYYDYTFPRITTDRG